MCWHLRTLLLNLGSFVYMDLKTLKFDLETSCEASEILHSRTSLLFGVGFFSGFEKCYPFYSVELVFLLGQVLLININVFMRCVGTTAHLNTCKCITAAVLQIFAVFITWIATT